MLTYSVLFEDDNFIYIQMINNNEIINKKIDIKEYNNWKLDKINFKQLYPLFSF